MIIANHDVQFYQKNKTIYTPQIIKVSCHFYHIKYET